MKTAEQTVAEVLESIVAFQQPERPIDEVVDDLGALLPFARRNRLPQGALVLIAQCHRIGAKMTTLLLSTEGLEEMVGLNFKAMVYGTLDEILLRVAVSSMSWSPFTILTTGLSFVLQRMAEYAYVESAQSRQTDYMRVTCLELADEMWEALAHNPQTQGVTWEKCLEYRELVRQVRSALDGARSPELILRLYTLLFYVRLIGALDSLRPRAAAPITK